MKCGITGLLFFAVSQILGQVSYSNEFLNIGVGARSHGMAGAVEATEKNINAAYWNPAGLANIHSSLQLGVMHSEWFGGVGKYDHIALAKSINKEKRSVGAISMVRLAIDQIPNTLNLVGPDGSIRFENVSEFSAADYGFLISYASALGLFTKDKSLHIGGNVKIIHRIIGPFAKAWGFGLDGGLQWIRPRWQLGIVAHDLSTTFTGWNYSFTEEQKAVLARTNNLIPVSTLEKTLPRLGLAFEYKISITDKMVLNPEVGFNLYFDGKRNTPIASKLFSLEPKLGVEFGYHELVFIRLGYGNIQKIKDELNINIFQTRGQLNTGLGIKLGQVNIDYALANIGNLAKEVNYSHVFSATLNFVKE